MRILSFILLCFIWNGSWAQNSITVLDFQNIENRLNSDAFWSEIPESHFVQLEPNKGSLSVEPTKFIVAYDSLNVYVYVRCFQKQGTIIANTQARDNLTKNDDAIALVLDTYNDRRTGYGFLVNPLGTQTDFRISDDGRTIDINWDTEWNAHCDIYHWGWQAEIIIPFESLKFKRTNSTWGFNMGRIIRYNFEDSWWSGEMNNDFRISQGGFLTGLSTPSDKSHFLLYPYLRTDYLKERADEYEERFSVNAGGDLRINFSDVQGNLTYNPDFATVEGDRERINLSRYELQYPEKRLFFQEGNEMFNTRIETFYSRRIGDIDYGGKVTGKVSGYRFNALTTKSSDQSDLDTTGAWYTAVMVRKDILNSSVIGLSYVDKTWQGNGTRSLSTDYVLNIGKTWKLTGQLVASWPGDFFSHSAFYLRFARESNIYHYHLRYSNIGENFQENVNQTGFITDDDRHEFDSDVSYRWWMEGSHFIQYIDAETRNNIFWSQSGVLRSWYLTDVVRIYLKNKLSLDLLYNNEFKLFEKKYYNHKWGMTLGFNTDEWNFAEADFQFGKNFDRDFYLLSLRGRIRVFEKLSLDYSGDYLKFSPDTTNSSTFINILSVNYYFTKDLWIRMFLQNNSNLNRFYVYGLVGWRFKPPFGAVYLIYSRNDQNVPPENYYAATEIIYFKFTYPIRFW